MTPSNWKTVRKISKSCKLKLQNFSGKSGIFERIFCLKESQLYLRKEKDFTFRICNGNVKHLNLYIFLEFLVTDRVLQNSRMNMHLYKAHACLFYLHLLEI
jgi:hypothetical protein